MEVLEVSSCCGRRARLMPARGSGWRRGARVRAPPVLSRRGLISVRLVARGVLKGGAGGGVDRDEWVLAGGAALNVAERVAMRCAEAEVGGAGGLRLGHAFGAIVFSQLASTTASTSARVSDAVLIAAASPALRPYWTFPLPVSAPTRAAASALPPTAATTPGSRATTPARNCPVPMDGVFRASTMIPQTWHTCVTPSQGPSSVVSSAVVPSSASGRKPDVDVDQQRAWVDVLQRLRGRGGVAYAVLPWYFGGGSPVIPLSYVLPVRQMTQGTPVLVFRTDTQGPDPHRCVRGELGGSVRDLQQ